MDYIICLAINSSMEDQPAREIIRKSFCNNVASIVDLYQ